MKFKKDFSHEEATTIAGLCCGVALLIVAALFISGGVHVPSSFKLAVSTIDQNGGQAAATALGNQQSVPVGSFKDQSGVTHAYPFTVTDPTTGLQTPAYTKCFINDSPGYGGISGGLFSPDCGIPLGSAGGPAYSNSPDPGYAGNPWGASSGGDTDTFTAGIFSVDMGGGQGRSGYQTRTVTLADPDNTKLDGSPCISGDKFTVLDNGDGTHSYACFTPSGAYDFTHGPDCSPYGPNAYLAINNEGYCLIVGQTCDAGCYEAAPYPQSMSNPSGTAYAGSAPTVAVGTPYTLEWSCLPGRAVLEQNKGGQGIFSNGDWSASYLYNYPTITSSLQGSTSNDPLFPSATFAAQGLVGSHTIVPTTAGTYTYALNCFGGTNQIPITVTVTGSPAPTVAITANGQSGSVSAVSGAPVNIVATFAPAGSYTGSAINDFANNALTSQSASSPKNYTFNSAANPAAPGSYLFNAAVQTSDTGWANNYGKSVTVVITAAPVACPANCPGPNAPNCVANSGFTYNSSNNTCSVNACAGGQINPPTCTVCSPGFHNNASNICVPDACSDPHAGNPPTCSCLSPYTGPNGGPCVVTPTLSLTAAQSRVQKGSSASLSWSVINLTGDPTVQCSIASTPSTAFSRVMPGGTEPTWSGTNVASGPIMGTTIFTLSCTGSTPVSKTVTVIPTVIEI